MFGKESKGGNKKQLILSGINIIIYTCLINIIKISFIVFIKGGDIKKLYTIKNSAEQLSAELRKLLMMVCPRVFFLTKSERF